MGDIDKQDLNTAILVFAHYLGINLDTEKDLLRIAEEAFDNLPKGWDFGIGEGDNAGIPYFYNTETGESEWKHPEEDIYMRKVKRERAQNKKKARTKRGDDRNSGDLKKSSRQSSRDEEPDYEEAPLAPDPRDEEILETAPSKASKGGGGFGLTSEDFLDDVEDFEAPEHGRASKVQSFDVVEEVRDFSDREQDSGFNRSRDRDNKKKVGFNDYEEEPARKGKVAFKGFTENFGGSRSRSPSPSRYEENNKTQKNNYTDDGEVEDFIPRSKGNNAKKSGNVTFREEGSWKGNNGSVKKLAGSWDRSAEDQKIDNKRSLNSFKESRVEFKEIKKEVEKELQLDFQKDLSREQERYQAEIDRLKSQISVQQEKNDTLRSRHLEEVTGLRDDVRRLEERLAEERTDRKTVEDRLSHSQTEIFNKVRDAEEKGEIKLREAVRRVRTEVEEESQEKIRLIERRGLDEQDILRNDNIVVKRKLEEANREIDNLKRKVNLSKTDGKMEALAEADALKLSMRDLEDQNQRLEMELRNSRSEKGALQAQLTSALQNAQVAQMEAEACKTSAMNAAKEEQIHSGALTSATVKMQRLEAECAQLKAQAVLLKQEKEIQLAEIRKLQGSINYSGERLNSSESENRRIRQQLQTENGRLQSKVSELDALCTVLRDQLERASSSEAQTIRETLRESEGANAEAARLRDRVADMEIKEEQLLQRIREQEKELVNSQEQLFRKDKNIREEQLKMERFHSQIEEIRTSYEKDLKEAERLLQIQKTKNVEDNAKHRQEIAKLHEETSNKIPQIVENTVQKMQTQLQHKHSMEIQEMQTAFEMRTDQFRQEFMQLQRLNKEKEARQQLQLADEKVELDYLRQNCRNFQRANEELEVEIALLKKHLRFVAATSVALDSSSLANPQQMMSSNYNTRMYPESPHPRDQHFHQNPRNSYPPEDISQGQFMSSSQFEGFSPFYRKPPSSPYRTHQNQQITPYQQLNQNQELQQHVENDAVTYLQQQMEIMKKQLDSALNKENNNNTTNTNTLQPKITLNSPLPREGGARGHESNLFTTESSALDHETSSLHSFSLLGPTQPVERTIEHSRSFDTDAPNLRSREHLPPRPPSSGEPNMGQHRGQVTFSPETLFESADVLTARARHEDLMFGSNPTDGNLSLRKNSFDSFEPTTSSVRGATVGDRPASSLGFNVEERDFAGNFGFQTPTFTSSVVQSKEKKPNVNWYNGLASHNQSVGLGSSGRNQNPGGFGIDSTTRRSFPGDEEFSTRSFDAISDGGYHEGYWRSKYNSGR